MAEWKARGISLRIWITISLAESVQCNYFGTLESVNDLQLTEEDLGDKLQ